jgi:acyl-CoA synthetase (AMP-forming)/AMP-acid ligase II
MSSHISIDRNGESATPALAANLDTAAILWSAFESRRRDTLLSFCDGGEPLEVSWDEWRKAAESAGAALRLQGVQRGSRVACVLTNTFESCAAALGIWLAGGSIVSLPTPSRGMEFAEYTGQLRRICTEVSSELVLVDAPFVEYLTGAYGLDVRVASFDSLAAGPHFEPQPPATEELAFVQYSSGSTTDPKGCALTVRAVASQVRRLGDALQISDRDQGVMWLPMSHDMGFFGCLMMSFQRGMKLLVSSPQRFLRSPRTWLADCAELEATITAGPNSALEQAVRLADGSHASLARMRKFVLGGERVERDTLAAAARLLADRGADPSCLTPAYGLAEAVLAVSTVDFREAPRVLHLDAAGLGRGELLQTPAAPADRSVSAIVGVGRALPETEIRIDGASPVGEVCLSSSSLASGYIGRPELTRERFIDGELHTGDIGFLHEGELFITGRRDDLISVAGRNVYARDIEARMVHFPGIRRGSCVILTGLELGNRVLVMAEPARDALASPREVAIGLGREAVRVGGFRVHECMLLTPGTLPKTPSGKVQRHRCRALAEDPGTAAVARVRLS